MKKTVLFAAAVLAAALTGCGGRKMEAEHSVVLKLANNLPDDSATTQAVEWFGREVEKRTDGRVTVEIFNDSALGDGLSSLEQLQYGGTDIVKADLASMGYFVEDFNVLAMPYIYDSGEHFWRVHNGTVGQSLLHSSQMKEQGMYGLAYYDGGTRCFYNSKGEIRSPKDLKGMMIRVQQSELMTSMVKALGAKPVISDYSDVYRVLQTKEAEGAENSIVNYLSQSFYEVAPYFAEDNHTRSADILVMSEESRKNISEEDLAVIDQTALESSEYQRKLWDEAEENAKKELKKKNVVITELTREEMEEFRTACEQIWYSYQDGKYIDLIDRIVAAGK